MKFWAVDVILEFWPLIGCYQNVSIALINTRKKNNKNDIKQILPYETTEHASSIHRNKIHANTCSMSLQLIFYRNREISAVTKRKQALNLNWNYFWVIANDAKYIIGVWVCLHAALFELTNWIQNLIACSGNEKHEMFMKRRKKTECNEWNEVISMQNWIDKERERNKDAEFTAHRWNLKCGKTGCCGCSLHTLNYYMCDSVRFGLISNVKYTAYFMVSSMFHFISFYFEAYTHTLAASTCRV